MNSNSNRLIYIAVSAILFVALLFELPIQVIGVINLLFLFFSFFSLSKVQKSAFTPFNVILACLFLFHSGHLWLSLVTSDVARWDYLFNYTATEAQKMETYSFVTQMIIVFYWAGMLNLKPYIKVKTVKEKLEKWTSPLLIFITICAYMLCFYYDIGRAARVQALGYGAGYQYESGFSYTVSVFLNELLILLFIVNRHNKRMLTFLISLVSIRFILVLALIGNRGAAIIFAIMIIYILAKYTSYSRFFSNKFSLFLIVLAGSIALPFISLTRNDYIKTNGVVDFIITYNPFTYFLAEFGGTIKTLFIAMEYNYEKFLNGAQFFYSSLAIFPGSDFLFGGSSREYIGFALVLNRLDAIRGLGGSLIANIYVNFGYSIFAYIAMGIMGWITSCFSNGLVQRKTSLYTTLIYFGMFFGMLTAVRGEWYDFLINIKLMAYLIILIWVASKLGYKLVR